MKAVLRGNALLPVAREARLRQATASTSSLQLQTGRNVSSTSPASSSRAAALAKAAEASVTASERLAAGGPPIMGPSYNARQDANRVNQAHRILADHDEAATHFNLSSSQARRSRAARFGTSRHVTYASPLPLSATDEAAGRPAQEDDEDEEQLALAYAAPTGTSTSSIYLPEYVAWAISQLIAASNDPKLLRADHLKLAHLTDPQEHLAEAAHIPPKRSSLLHLATVSPHRYAAILAVLSEVRQRLASTSPVQGAAAELDEALPRWTPDKVLDFDCAAGEGLWAAAQMFRQADEPFSPTSVQRYYGYDRRPNLLKSGKKVAQASASNVSPADRAKETREVKLKDGGEEIEVDGVTYYEQEPTEADESVEEAEPEEEVEAAVEYFSGLKSAMASVEKTFQSVPLAKDLANVGSGGGCLALSAFALSLMTNDANRFEAVQAMWNSGAEVIVIIDQATPRGFASVASARAQLLQLGKQDGGAAHVVAPCSHDKPCPLLHPFSISSAVASAVGVRSDTGNPAKSKDLCAFTARYHTPSFLRKTKHSDRGKENVGYSYVVVRRGPRPGLVREARRRLDRGGDQAASVTSLVRQMQMDANQTKTGILDMLRTAKKASHERRTLQEVDPRAALAWSENAASAAATAEGQGEADMSDEQAMDELLKLLPDTMKAELNSTESGSGQLTPEQLDSIMAFMRSSFTSTSTSPSSSSSSTATLDSAAFDLAAQDESGVIAIEAPSASSELAMRLESYDWPRLIKSPLKKGGHVMMDACCASGNIERFTISRASGKQAYQDARKSKWGDLFPHPPRSRSVVKVLNPLTALSYSNESTPPGVGEDVDRMDQLVLRAPSKLGKATGGAKKGKAIKVIGLDEGEDADDILRELFEDMHNEIDADSSVEAKGVGKRQVDRGVASYRLISPNLVTPTKKQEKRININYARKWDHSTTSTTSTNPATAARLANTRTNLNTRQPLPPAASNSAKFNDDDAPGFQSSLDAASRVSPRLRASRSSRKKSRGDWDHELFGH